MPVFYILTTKQNKKLQRNGERNNQANIEKRKQMNNYKQQKQTNKQTHKQQQQQQQQKQQQLQFPLFLQHFLLVLCLTKEQIKHSSTKLQCLTFCWLSDINCLLSGESTVRSMVTLTSTTSVKSRLPTAIKDKHNNNVQHRNDREVQLQHHWDT